MNKVVIWDFDGVILSSFEQAFAIIQQRYPTLSREEYARQFEGNINQAKVFHKPVQQIDFFKEYEKTILDAHIVPGISEVIQTLSQSYQQVIVSSTISILIEKYLTFHGLQSYFDRIFGNEVSKSKVEKFKIVFDHYKVSPDNCVFITDTLGDLLEAKEVSLPAVAILWGFHPKSTLEKGNPAAVAATPQALLTEIQKGLR